MRAQRHVFTRVGADRRCAIDDAFYARILCFADFCTRRDAAARRVERDARRFARDMFDALLVLI